MSKEAYTLINATENDFQFIYNLNKQNMKEAVSKTWGTWDEEFQKDFFTDRFDPNKYKLIIVNENKIGILSIQNLEYVKIDEIQISPTFQGKGIGSKILLDIVAKAQLQKKDVHLQVLKVNDRAKKLYYKLGFNDSGETETHYLMVKKLKS